jgi:hypothetical protein
VKKLLSIPDTPGVAPGRVLEAVAGALANENSVVTDETALVILKFIVEDCIRSNVTGPLLQYLLICSRAVRTRPEIAKADIWGQIHQRMDTERAAALELLQRLTVPTYEYGMRFVQRLTQIFVETKAAQVADALSAVLSQNDEFQTDPLLPVLKEGLAGPDPLLYLVILTGLGPKGFARISIRRWVTHGADIDYNESVAILARCWDAIPIENIRTAWNVV